MISEYKYNKLKNTNKTQTISRQLENLLGEILKLLKEIVVRFANSGKLDDGMEQHERKIANDGIWVVFRIENNVKKIDSIWRKSGMAEQRRLRLILDFADDTGSVSFVKLLNSGDEQLKEVKCDYFQDKGRQK